MQIAIFFEKVQHLKTLSLVMSMFPQLLVWGLLQYFTNDLFWSFSCFFFPPSIYIFSQSCNWSDKYLIYFVVEYDFSCCNSKYIPLLEKYPTFFFWENLVDFNEARLHEATLNLHTHAWFFSSLSIASVDGKQHLNELVFSALGGLSL